MNSNKSCTNLRPPSSTSPSPTAASKLDRHRRKSHDERYKRSSNIVSLSFRSESPSTGELQQDLDSSPKNSPQLNKSTNIESQTSSPVKKSSVNDIEILSKGSASSIKNDLSKGSKQMQLNCSSTSTAVSNSNVMPNLTVTETVSSEASSSVAASSASLNHLAPESNILAKLTSTSSLNSNSVTPTNRKWSNGLIAKKKKILSSSRQKKFHRQFEHVPADESVINYFSCAFVSDILLQGNLYIAENHFAFYSNVFGYVTKLLIPIKSVIKISKEKTVKIIPNAIAVATNDERHVFSSFISRESAYQLMVKIWQNLTPAGDIEMTTSSVTLKKSSLPDNLSSASTENIIKIQFNAKKVDVIDGVSLLPVKHTLQVVQNRRGGSSCDPDISEIEDDSSSAISCSESLLQKRLLLQTQVQHVSDSTLTKELNNKSDEFSASIVLNTDEKDLKATTSSNDGSQPTITINNTESSTITLYRFQIPKSVHIGYLGLLLAVILALIATFLIYRISQVQNGHSQKKDTIEHLNGNIPDYLDIYAEVLKWQKILETQRLQLAQIVLSSNLEQIAKISDSLETLSDSIYTNNNFDIENKISSIIMDGCGGVESCTANPTN